MPRGGRTAPILKHFPVQVITGTLDKAYLIGLMVFSRTVKPDLCWPLYSKYILAMGCHHGQSWKLRSPQT